jgi:EMC6
LSAWQGFVFYLVGYLAVTACVLAKNGDFARTKHWQTSYEVWGSQIFGGLLSFVLSWTLSYALVHGIICFNAVANVQYMIEYGKEMASGIVIGIFDSTNLELYHFLSSKNLVSAKSIRKPDIPAPSGINESTGTPILLRKLFQRSNIFL